jgi:hypothetical protein
MSIDFAQTAFTGLSGVTPNIVFIDTNDTVAKVTTAGYLNGLHQDFNIDLKNGYIALVNTQATPASQKVSSWFAISITGTPGNFTYSLVAPVQAGGAVFAGNVQAGLNGGPAGALISYPATLNTGFLEIFATSAGGNFNTLITNAAIGQTTTYTLPDPGVAATNFIISGSAGTQNITTGNLAVTTGNLIAGSSGHAGTLTAFPATAASGSFIISATNAGGNFNTTLTSAALAQASVYTLPDTTSAAARVLAAGAALISGNLIKSTGVAGAVVDAGFFIKAATTAAYGGGSTTNTFTANGLTAASIVTAVNLASTNSVSITKAVPGTNTLAITWSADPGAATTVSWIATSAAA